MKTFEDRAVFSPVDFFSPGSYGPLMQKPSSPSLTVLFAQDCSTVMSLGCGISG